MNRPEHLPDFASPPLSEVVTGVQFEEIRGFTSAHYGEVWDLFRSEFPNIAERPPLEPQFETFGGPHPSQTVGFRIGTSRLSPRLWFISDKDDHLLQMQSDRLLLNWRDRPEQHYPRYEFCAEKFMESLEVLSGYFEKNFQADVKINQVEVTYINHIPLEDFSEIGEWISLFSTQIGNIENLNMSCSEVISNSQGKPYARLTHDFLSAFENRTQKKAVQWTITFRGSPQQSGISDLKELLLSGRELIVNKFDAFTTDQAHKYWGKK